MTRREVIKGLRGVLHDLKTCRITSYYGIDVINEAIKHLEVDFFDDL